MRRRLLIYAAGIAVLTCACFAATRYVGAQQAGVTRYVYDERGRIHAVIPPSGDATVYDYDAAGNIVSVSRRSMSATAVVGFSPVLGPVGAAVTIYGMGFGAAPGENIVTFNGVAAQVVSASPTEIVATVPAGASDGPITVTSPSGSAVSASPFHVLTPVITEFSPTVGPLETSVNIRGRNFETVAADNVVKFNGVSAEVTSSTDTDVTALVPEGAKSGKISLTTPNGTARSSQDFFVVPFGYSADSVEVTGRIAFGESRRITFTRPDTVAVIIFDGSAGQLARLRLSQSELQSCSVYLLTPADEFLTLFSTDGSGGFTDPVALPEDSTYTIFIVPTGNSLGGITLSLYDDTGVGTIAPGGPSVQLPVAAPARDAHVTFEALAGQRVSLRLGNVTIPSGTVFFYMPGGYTLLSQQFEGGEGFVDATTLEANGTYTIFVEPQPAAGGAATLTLYDVVDASGSIDLGGPPLEVTTSVPGQNARVTFHADAGEAPTLNFSNVTVPGESVVTVTGGGAQDFAGSSGGQLVQPFTIGPGGGSVQLGEITRSANYTIFIDPQGPVSGSMTLSLTRPADITGTLSIDGPPVTVPFAVVGQNARLSFEGQAGQRVTLQATEVTTPASTISVIRPDGATLIGPVQVGPGGKSIDNITLPSSGTYTVFVDPTGGATGQMTLSLITSTGVITQGGPPVMLNLVTPGESASLTFSGVAGRRVSLLISEISLYSGTIAINKPDGTPLLPARYIYEGNFIDALTLPDSGTYTIVVTAPEDSTGSVTLALYDATEITAPIMPGGGQATFVIPNPGQNARLVFSGTQGQRVSLSVENQTIEVLDLSVVAPDGTVLGLTRTYRGGGYSDLQRPSGVGSLGFSESAALTFRDRGHKWRSPLRFAAGFAPPLLQECCFTRGFIDTMTLPASGVYTVYLDPNNRYTGSVTLKLHDVPADVTGPITPDGPTVPLSFAVPGQNARLSFEATAGQRMIIQVDDSTIQATDLAFYNPDDTRGKEGSVYQGGYGGFIESDFLSADGTYSIFINPQGYYTGDISLRLISVPADVTAEITAGGPPVSFATTAVGQNARLTFDGAAGQRVSVLVNNVTVLAAYAYLIGPDGTVLNSGAHFGQGGTAFIDSIALPSNGRYTILIDPQTNYTGGATVTLHDASDVLGTVEVSGPPVTITTTFPGQRAVLSFDGIAGQWLRVNVPSTTVPRTDQFSPPSSITVVAPDGTSLGGLANFATAFDLFSLPVTGTYKVVIDPYNQATGSTTVSIAEVPPVGTISIDGGPTNVSTQAGRISRMTFESTAGQRVSLTASSPRSAEVSVYGPDASRLAEMFTFNSTFIDAFTLPATGTYHVAVRSFGSGDGSSTATVALHGINDVTGAIAAGGPPVPVTIAKPGQRALLTFHAEPGQTLGISLTEETGMSGYLKVLKPDGTDLHYPYYFFGQGAFIQFQPDATGTHTIVLDPNYMDTGSATVRLFEMAPDVTGAVEVNGPPKSLAVTTPGQMAVATFSGVAGQTVTVKTDASGVTDCFDIYLTAPDGTFLAGDFRCADGLVEFGGLTLPADGVYTLKIDPIVAGTGTFTITVTSP